MLDIDALKQELHTARDLIESQLRGIEDLQRAAPTSAFADELSEQRKLHISRRDKLTTVIRAIDTVHDSYTALKGDGYPDVNITPIDSGDLRKMLEEIEAMRAASDLFGHEASEASVDLGQPAPKS